MTFLAQVALDELPADASPEGLPRRGSLAFFAKLRNGEPEGTVVAVDPSHDAAEAGPPDDLPPIYGDDLQHIRGELPFPDGAPVAFPRWPVRFATEAPEKHASRPRDLFDPRDLDAFPLRPEALDRVLRLIGTRVNVEALARIDTLLAELSREAAEPAPFVRPRPSLLERFVPRFRYARAAALRAAEAHREKTKRLAFRTDVATFRRSDMARRLTDLHTLAPRAAAAVARATPEAFRPEDAQDVAALYRTLLSAMRSDNPNHHPVIQPSFVSDARIAEIVEYALSGDTAWDSLTEAERALVAADLAEDPDWPHQMFGEGADIQGYGPPGQGVVMLLQLFCDDTMGWVFGDMGRIQFLVEVANLRAGRWERSRVEIEGH